MSAEKSNKVDYLRAARRHRWDAQILTKNNSTANSGQLLGFSVECGLKALLLACGGKKDPEGGTAQKEFRQHLPSLHDSLLTLGEMLPDGRRSVHYCAMLTSLPLVNWSVEQRYWHDNAVPVVELNQWQQAELEVAAMLDQLIIDGMLNDNPI